MIGTKLYVCNIIILLVTSPKLLIRAEEKLNDTQNETQSLKVFPGIKFFLADGEITIHVKIRDLLQVIYETERQARKKDKNPLQKLGYMMMMTPFTMQILSLPGAIASLKMSFLKSLMVAQLAIAIMFYNLLRSEHNTDVVVVHQPQPQQHYHHSYHHPEDEDEWFGR